MKKTGWKNGEKDNYDLEKEMIIILMMAINQKLEFEHKNDSLNQPQKRHHAWNIRLDHNFRIILERSRNAALKCRMSPNASFLLSFT